MYIAIYNKKYKKQFEALVSKEDWDNANLKYGTVGAAVGLVKGCYRKKKTRRSTTPKRKSFEAFVDGMIVAPHIYGQPIIKVGNTKKEVLDRGLGEYYVWSPKKKKYRGYGTRSLGGSENVGKRKKKLGYR